MIQRIQSVWLAIICMLCIAGLCSNVAYYTDEGNTIAEFSNFTFSTENAFKTMDCTGPWALGILLILVVLISLVSLLLFRKRMRQLRLCIFSSILLLGYIGVYVFFAYIYQLKLESFISNESDIKFHLSVAAVYPVLCLILNALAIHGIRKDEALVRSLNRLR
ncbi:MAG: DUF4293 domain-containing protein [Bacteroides sp.]|nr:DUF4293 domain-containing protein [Roseburia sp.]MCM1347659.1 DUF4293 domain-containing protein [Bacteroides sp.]MCM1422093.1 DUF4293 domain-containing protein [Bacteroides sp.]